VAGNGQASARGPKDAGQGTQCRRLAGAIGTDQAENLTRLDSKADARDRYGVAIILMIILDHYGHRWYSLRLAQRLVEEMYVANSP
jgi:hypothetical protein